MKIIFNKADELDGLHLLKLRDRVRATVEQQTVLRSVRDGHTMQILRKEGLGADICGFKNRNIPIRFVL